METSKFKLVEVADHLRECRNGLGRFIGYHRIEIERIARKTLYEQDLNGEPRVVPQVIRNLPNDLAFGQLFLP